MKWFCQERWGVPPAVGGPGTIAVGGHHILLYTTFAISKKIFIFVEVSCIRNLFTQTDPGSNVPGFCLSLLYESLL